MKKNITNQENNKKEKVLLKNNSNVFQILSKTSKILNDNWSELSAASVLAIFSVVALILFPVFGFALTFFASGLISLGYIQFALKTIRNKKPDIEVVFQSYKVSFSAFALRLIMCLFVFLWSILLIVPGIVCAINYSFAMTIMSENPKTKTFNALQKSKELVKGYRDIILCIYLMTFLFMVLIYFAVLAFPLLLSLVVVIDTWVIFVVALVIALLVYGILLLPYMEIALCLVYEEAKANASQTKKTGKKTAQMVEKNQDI